MTATASLFFALVVATAAGIACAAWRYLPRRSLTTVLLALPIWLVYVGTLSMLGIVGNAGLKPPGVVYLFVPVFLYMFFFAVRSRAAAAAALAFPLWLLTAAQVFRVAVEVGLHRLGVEGLVPRLMTYDGGNVDIVIGLTAPIVAWLAASGRISRRLALGWNILGLLALANVAVRAALTAPGPLHFIHADVPNLAIGMFPYTYIAGFFAPLAVLLHVLSIRALRVKARADGSAHWVVMA